MRYHFIPTRIAIIKKPNNNKCWWGNEEIGKLIHCWWGCRLMQPHWKTVWQFLQMLNVEFPCDLAIPFLVIYPRGPKTGVQTKAWTWMFKAALLIIAKKWKWPKCPSTEEWINKLWYIHTVGYYLAIKIGKILIHAMLMNLENMLSERIQSQKTTYCMI